MFRLVLPAVLLSACTSPVARERVSFSPDISTYLYYFVDLSDSFTIDVSINDVGRDLETELTVRTGGFLPSGAFTTTELYDANSDLVASDASSDTRQSSTVNYEIPFPVCDGPGFVLDKEGSCSARFIGTSTYDDVYLSAEVEVSVAAYAPRDWEGDPDSVVLTLDVVN